MQLGCWFVLLLTFNALVIGSNAQFPLYKKANLTIPSSLQDHFKPRVTVSFTLPILPVGAALISLDPRTSFRTIDEIGQGNDSASLESIWGAAWVATGFPTALLAHFDFDITATNLTNIPSFNFSGAANIMASAYTHLYEIDSVGNVIKETNLATNYTWLPALLESGVTEHGKIHYITFLGEYSKIDFSQPSLQIRLTFIMVTEAMVVNLLDTPIVPRSVECIVRISGYRYASATNRLVLQTFAATGGVGQAARARMNIGSGSKEVYYKLGQKAFIDDKEHEIVVSDWIPANKSAILASGYANFLNLVATKYGNSSDADLYIARANITFPPNASTIQYDPTSGSGISVDALFAIQDEPVAPGELSQGAIAGIVIGAVVVIAAIFIVIAVTVVKCRTKIMPYKDTE